MSTMFTLCHVRPTNQAKEKHQRRNYISKLLSWFPVALLLEGPNNSPTRLLENTNLLPRLC